jgi:hypothetical protein
MSFDCNEPPHVHVERDDDTCKFGSSRSDWQITMVLALGS